MAAMLVMSIPAGVFLFDEHVRYPFYLAPARPLAYVSALADQQTAGVLMLVAGGVVMGVLAIVIAMSADARRGATPAAPRPALRRPGAPGRRCVEPAGR